MRWAQLYMLNDAGKFNPGLVHYTIIALNFFFFTKVWFFGDIFNFYKIFDLLDLF